MSQFESVIGLEVHAQLVTKSKIFCGCSTVFGAPPNSHTCEVCLGMPGSLPVLNKKVVEYAMRMALATHCRIAHLSCLARKNYFYPDLPKGYQISQYELPLAENGYLEIDVDGRINRIGITRIHMEEDAGKLIHDEMAPISLVDFNRTGVPLIEIVSEPDMRTPEEAVEYLKALRNILRYLDICDGNMEEGSFRCDANVSLRPEGTETLGTRTELKNMNSFRHVQKALEYEIRRQTATLLDGKAVVQETRLWDAGKNVTVSMRGKEEAHDYRYFPDPDLVPLVIDENWIEGVRAFLPELPDAKRTRFVDRYGLPEYDAAVLTDAKDLADYFETTVRLYNNPKIVSNWIMSELLRELKRDDREIEACPVRPEGLAEMLGMMDKGVISGKIAKTIFTEMYATGKDPGAIVKERCLVQVSDPDEIRKVVEAVTNDHPEQVERFRQGKTSLLGYFVGEVMKRTRGKANPKLVNEILGEILK
ncbi:MAG: Asp-tRNA(Asn)/Glu-tRNA(Gln) amidotransferase subunit GatB [Pseudomonadota bacterium]